MGDLVRNHMKIFTIETTLNGDTFHSLLSFLTKRVKDWNVMDKISFHGSRVMLKLLPSGLRRKAYNSLPSAYGLTGVHAGETEAVHAKTLVNVNKQQIVRVPQAYDIVIVGLPSIGPYNVDSILNPVLVHCLGLGYFFNFYRNNPYIKKGGVMIMLHPIENKFHMVHHPSYYDFFNDLIPQTREPAELEKRFEKSYAENERYIDLYRKSYAYHGVHPFYMWYWGAHGRDHVGTVIAVDPVSTEATRLLGYEIAPDLNSAIGMARDIAGTNASMAYFQCPPVTLCDVA